MHKKRPCAAALLAVGLLVGARMSAAAYTLDLESTDSVKVVAAALVDDTMSFYHGNEPGKTPGLLDAPYYWWEAGALMGTLIDYWHYTGDTRWNNVAMQGMLHQVGPNDDYMPPNQTVTEGNDDQGFWGLAVMRAAETRFPNPPKDKPQWLALAQAVFNTQAARWDTGECGGGLRWQIFTWNKGFDYKNSISQACFFNLAARLALYTNNQSYADWAEVTWDWMVSARLIDLDYYYIYDGIHTFDCLNRTPYQWSYNAGAFLLGAAAMYNYTVGETQARWRERVDGLLNGSLVFFKGSDGTIMSEVACEPVNLCDNDQQSFKAYFARWMAATTKWAPWTYPRIRPLLSASAKAAVSTCIGGNNGRMCGLKWTEGAKWDGFEGVGEQMAALEVLLATMVEHVDSPATDQNGGISVGNPGAGGSDIGRTDPSSLKYQGREMAVGDRVAAAFLTVLLVLGLAAGCVWVLLDEYDSNSGMLKLLWPNIPWLKLSWWRGLSQRRDDRMLIQGVRRFRERNGSTPPSYQAEPIVVKDDLVIKTHDDFSLEDFDWQPSRHSLPAQLTGGIPRNRNSDTTIHWAEGLHKGFSAKGQYRQRGEPRHSYPGTALRPSEELRKRAMENSWRTKEAQQSV